MTNSSVKVCVKQNKTNIPSHADCQCKQLKLRIGALPLNPNTTSLVLSTKGPNRTRYFACHPSPNCVDCTNVIKHYNNVKRSLHDLEKDMSKTSCRRRCYNARDAYLIKNQKNIETSTTTFLEMHFLSHRNCGTIMDVSHLSPVTSLPIHHSNNQ